MIPYLPPRLRICLHWAEMAVCLLALGSCSDSAAIAKELAFVRETTRHAEAQIVEIVAETQAPAPDLGKIANLASVAVSDLHSIDSSTEAASRHLTGVKDVTPWWASMITWVAAAAAIVAVVVLAWRFGLDRLVAALLSWVSIPSPSARAAKLDADALAESPTPQLRESIAAKRTSNARYDLEFSKRQRSLDAESGRAARKEKHP